MNHQISSIMLVLIAMFILAINRILLKFVSLDISAIQVTFIMYIFGFFFARIYIKLNKLFFDSINHECKFSVKRIKLIEFGPGALRGVICAISAILLIYALKTAPVGSVIAIFYVKILISIILSGIFLGERTYLFNYIFCFMSMSGIAIVTGASEKITYLELIAVLLSAFFSSLLQILLKITVKNQTPLETYIQLSLYSFVILLIPSIFYWKSLTILDVFLLCISGFASFLSQYLLGVAYFRAEVSALSTIDSTQIVFALILGNLFFDEKLTFKILIGMLLIWSSVFAKPIIDIISKGNYYKKHL